MNGFLIEVDNDAKYKKLAALENPGGDGPLLALLRRWNTADE